jgi:hypothetical protein
MGVLGVLIRMSGGGFVGGARVSFWGAEVPRAKGGLVGRVGIFDCVTAHCVGTLAGLRPALTRVEPDLCEARHGGHHDHQVALVPVSKAQVDLEWGRAAGGGRAAAVGVWQLGAPAAGGKRAAPAQRPSAAAAAKAAAALNTVNARSGGPAVPSPPLSLPGRR